jgi:hypothetical protein
MLRKTSRLLAVVLLCGVGQAGVSTGAAEARTIFHSVTLSVEMQP